MLDVAGYDLINKKIIIANPFHYFYELKNCTESEVVSKLLFGANSSLRSDLYERILENIVSSNEVGELLIQRELENHLTELDIAFRVLITRGLIRSKYKVKYNTKKLVIDMVIDELKITSRGVEALNRMKSMKAVDLEFIVKMFVSACKSYTETTDILKVSKETLVNDFSSIINEITTLDLISFEFIKKKDIHIDHLTGKIVVNNFSRFKKFISEQSNSKLENTLKQILSDSINRITEIKIILNAIETASLRNIHKFMREDVFVNSLLYMVLEEYIKLDISYTRNTVDKSFSMTIHKVIITDKGSKYFNSSSLIKLKEQVNITKLISKSLKEYVKQNNANVKDSDIVLKDLVASEHLS